MANTVSISDLTIPPEEFGRQAVASLRGYAYQIISSALAWTELSDDELLLLEVADDYSVVSHEALALRQSKDTAGSGSVTLRTSGVVAALNGLWRFREANRNRKVSLAYLTTSTPGREQGVAWPDNRSGLVFWRDAARDGVDLTQLRDFLTTLDLDEDMKAWLRTASDDEVRTKLLRAVRWECGQPLIGELDTLLHERLVILCDRLGAPASFAHALRSLVVVELLRAAVEPDAEGRRRSRARLLELAEQATSVSLPVAAFRASLGLAGRDEKTADITLERLDAVPAVPWSIARPAAEDRLYNQVCEGVAWLTGASGTGKTMLARSLSRRSNRPWFVVDLRDAQANEVTRRLRLARRMLGGRSDVAGIVLDDLPIGSVASAKHELALTAAQLARADAALLVTAYQPPPPTLATELGIAPEAVVEAPYFEEAEVEDLIRAAGGDPKVWAKPVHLFCGGGHAQLVAARVAGLRSRGWPRSELVDGFETGVGPRDVEAEREATRKRLLAELPSDARTLLFRLSVLIGDFDRDLAVAVGATAPAISLPGALLDLLTGPWLEPRPGSALRVSPLVQGAAGKVMSPAETRAVHITVADDLVRRDPFPGGQLPQLLLSSLLTEHVGGLSIVAIAALSPQIANAELRGTLFVLPLLSTDKPLIGTEPGLNRMLRLGQLKMAALDEDADRLDAIFRRFLVEAEGAEGEALQRGMAAYIALSADKARIPPARWFSYLAEIEACDFSSIQSAATLLRAAGDDAIEDYRADDEIEGDELDGVGIDIKDPATALFSLRVGGIRDILELEALFDALSALEPKRRRHYLNSLPEPYLGRRMMTQIAWLRSSEQVGFDGKDAAGRFAAMQARAEAWEDQELAKECLCSRLVLLAEYASDNDGALQLLEEAERRWPSDARLRRERAKIYFRQGRFDEVLQHESELLKDASGSEPVERTHVTREVALSAGESGDLKRAIELFAQAEMIAGESASLSDMRVGLAADRAFCIWRDGRRHEALAEVQDALLAVESLNQTTKRGEYLVRAISIVIRAMYRDLTSPGWDRDFPSLLGVVSRSPHEWSEAPAPTVLSGWYQLESVERSLGADAGVAARLRDRTATSKIVSFEFIKCSVEYLGTIQGGDMAAVVRGLSEFARAGAYARREATLSTDDGLQDDLFDAVEVLPWDGPFNPADDTQRSIVIGAISAAAGFALARGETDWFVRLREASVTEPQLAAFLKMLLGAGNFHPRGPLPISRFWALEAIRKTALAPDDLILVSVRLWEWLGDTVLSRELAEVICPMIAQHWRRVAVEARFALRTPGTTAPAILAATEEVTDRVGLGRLILVAFSGLSVRPAPELLASLREQTEDSHVTSDALSKHVYRRTGGQQP